MPENKHHIFISYSRKDAVYATALADYLTQQGFNIWFDIQEIHPSHNFPLALEKAIKTCAAFVTLMSTASGESKWVRNEGLFAYELGKPAFPILLNGNCFLLYISTQYVDLRNLILEENENRETAVAKLAPFIPPSFIHELKQYVKQEPHYGGIATITQETVAPQPKVSTITLRQAVADGKIQTIDDAVRYTISLCLDLSNSYQSTPVRSVTAENVLFMPGENARIELPPDPTTDREVNPVEDTLQAGHLLYFMLSGQFYDEAQCPISELNPKVRPALQRIVAKSLMPGAFPTPKELQDRLEIYLSGAELRQVIENHGSKPGPLFGVAEVLQQAIRLCTQLEEDHERGLAHQNLTSDNIVMSEINQIRRVQWLRSSIAAPERIPDDSEAKEDVEAIGVILYEMLTGYTPDEDLDAQGIPQFTRASQWIKIGLDRTIQKAISPNPEDRFCNILVLRERLHDWVTQLAFATEVENLMNARYPLLYITSWEESRVFEFLTHLAQIEGRNIYGWTAAQGLFDHEGLLLDRVPKDAPVAILDYIFQTQEDDIYVLYDFHHYLRADYLRIDPLGLTRRTIRDLALQIRYGSRKSVVIVSPIIEVPPECEKDTTILQFGLPRFGELADLLDETIKLIKQANGEVQLTNKEYEDLVRSAVGLTVVAAERAFLQAVVKSSMETQVPVLGPDAVKLVLSEKERAIRVGGALQVFSTPEDFGDIGGLDILKEWIRKRGQGFSIEAKDFGLPAPKGVLLIGIPGCGKSLAAKVIASEWKKPLLRLDAGALFGSRVGSSERNLRDTLNIAEAIAPSILWIDEIEKAFAGVNSANDSGVTARVFGAFLTWLQEKTAPVFVVATANNIGNAGQGRRPDRSGGGIPPELLRRGRFDDLFFVDLPNTVERRQIFEIHLKKRNHNPAQFDLDLLAGSSQDFSGAEIEQVVISAMFDAFAGYNDQIQLNALQYTSSVFNSILDDDTSDLGRFTDEELQQGLQELMLEEFGMTSAREASSPAIEAVRQMLYSSEQALVQLYQARTDLDERVKRGEIRVELTNEVILANISGTQPLAKIMAQEIQATRDWAHEKQLRFASLADAPPEPAKRHLRTFRGGK